MQAGGVRNGGILPEELEMIDDLARGIVDYSRAERIEKGFSFERKYLLYGTDGREYIMRVAAAGGDDEIKRKNTEFDVIHRLVEFSSLVPRTYSFGTLEDGAGRSCYMILEFIPGSDLEEMLPKLGEEEQYELGLQAGRELAKLHRLDAPVFSDKWHVRYSRKYARKCEVFDEFRLDPGMIDMSLLSRFIIDNGEYMRCRREAFLHDDYHPANLVVSDGRLAGIIDYNRYYWGDPVHDFVKLAYFSSAISVPFSAGQIDGYNGANVPCEFWKKYSLYAAMTIVPDMVWSHWYSRQTGSPGEIGRMMKRVEKVWLDHDGFSEEIPGWYRDF